MAATAPAQIRPFRPGDRDQVLALAPRLTNGVASWRDLAAVRRAVQGWAAGRGLAFLTLQTGAANQPARDLYRQLGYREEDVRLTKAIPAATSTAP